MRSKPLKEPLSITHPQLAAQWHPTKNGNLTPDQVVAGSHKKAWWICPIGSDHQWEASIGNRARGKGCPFCQGLKLSVTNSLASLYPEIAKQWHPTKNDNLTPAQVVAGSHKKAWWKCPNGSDHEWEASIGNRANGNGCPFCRGLKPSITNSLASLYPEIAKQWHPTKNGTLTSDQVVAGSNKKAWWKCPNSSAHEWEASPNKRTKLNRGCPFCAGQKPSDTNCLSARYPELAAQWHPTKNSPLTPDRVVTGTHRKAWWKCLKDPKHEWDASIASRVTGVGCPFCAGKKPSDTNSLALLYPEIAKEWHLIKNGSLTPDQVTVGSGKQVWWVCSNSLDHEWRASIDNRVSKRSGCPFCAGRSPSVSNSLASLYPEIAKQWHPTKNGTLTPDQVVAGSHKKAWWKCHNGSDHQWDASIETRVSGVGCPFCAGRKPSITNSLASLYPEIANEWHPEKNGKLTPDKVVAGSHKKIWWRCGSNPSHEWETSVETRTNGSGCPACSKGWTVAAIRGFVSSLINYLETFTPSELYLLFQQNGMLKTTGKGKSFLKALATGRFPKEEIEKFVNGKPSTVDKFLQDKQLTLEALETSSNNDIPNKGDVTSQDNLDDQIDETVEPSEEEDLNLPVVQTREVLTSLNHPVVSSADQEAVEFLIASAKAKIWKHVFRDEAAAVTQAQTYTGEGYAQKVKSEFLDEYHQAKNLPIPTGYNFRINGKLTEPNLMQRLVAVQVRDKKRVGNWSGTGAGKTLSAVLASRVIDAHLTVICCPNSVVDGWEKAILNIFPDSVVAKKTFTPDWIKATADDATTSASSRASLFKATGYTQVLGLRQGVEDPPKSPHLRSGLKRGTLSGSVPPFQRGTLSGSVPPFLRGGSGDLNCRNKPENPHYLILNYEIFLTTRLSKLGSHTNQQPTNRLYRHRRNSLHQTAPSRRYVRAQATSKRPHHRRHRTQSRFARYRNVRHASYQQPPGRQKSS